MTSLFSINKENDHIDFTILMCRLKRQHIGITLLVVAASAASSSVLASGRSITVGPNHSKLGMHVSRDTSVSMEPV